jgi:hypothetical protein
MHTLGRRWYGLSLTREKVPRKMRSRRLATTADQRHDFCRMVETIGLTPVSRCHGRPHTWWGRTILYVDNVGTLDRVGIALGLTPTPLQKGPWGERYFHQTNPHGRELGFAGLLPIVHETAYYRLPRQAKNDGLSSSACIRTSRGKSCDDQEPLTRWVSDPEDSSDVFRVVPFLHETP